MIIQGSPDILQGPRGLNNQFGAFAATEDTVVQLYQQILQRTPSASEIAYWSAGWGGTVEASEIKDFQDAAAPERIAADAWRAEQAAIAAAAAQQAAAAAQLAAIEAANRKAVADAYAAAQAAAKAAAEAAATANVRAQQREEAIRKKAIEAVRALYLQVLGREGDTEGLNYFADKFGEVVDPDELQIFSDMAQPEIDARNKYLAEMATKSADDAAKAKAIADNFAATAAKAVEDAKQAAGDNCPPGYAFDGETCRPTGLAPPPTTSGGINPALILAAAAAAFFIGG
jgi:colicin import membrane protein